MKALAKVVVKNPVLWVVTLLCGLVIAMPAIKGDDTSGYFLGQAHIKENELRTAEDNFRTGVYRDAPEEMVAEAKEELALLRKTVSTKDVREFAELRARYFRDMAEGMRAGRIVGGTAESVESQATFYERLAALPDPAIYENNADVPAAWYLSSQAKQPLIIWMLPMLVAALGLVAAVQGKRLLVQAPVAPVVMAAAQLLLLMALSVLLLLLVCLPSFAVQTVRVGIGDLSYPIVNLMGGVQFDETVGSVLARQGVAYLAIALLAAAISLAGTQLLRGRMAHVGVLAAGIMCAMPLIASYMQASVWLTSGLPADPSLYDPLVPYSAFAYLGDITGMTGYANYWPNQDVLQDTRLSFAGGLAVLVGWAVVAALAGLATIAVRRALARRGTDESVTDKRVVNISSLMASGLTLAYGKRTLLHNTSLALSPGEIVGLIAPNGRGKTTLLEALTGLNAVRRTGAVTANGAPLANTAAFRKQVLYVPCDAALLYPNLTAADHIKMAASLWPDKVDTGKLIALCQLEGYLNRPVRTYSSGMKQQLALAVAYCTGVRYLLLDEPMNALDPGNVSLNSYILKRLAGHGMGVLFSSHILSNVDELCGAVVAIEGTGEAARLVRHGLTPGGPAARELYDEAFGQPGPGASTNAPSRTNVE